MVKQAHLHRFNASLAYYYRKASNHEKAVLREAVNTPLNDEDMDQVHKDLNNLKIKVSDLLKEIDTNSDRKLG
jgi:hypothetical protein